MSAAPHLPPAIGAVVRLWLARARSPHSRRAYLADISAFTTFAGVDDLASCKLADLVDWRDHLEAAGASSATVKRRIAAVRSLATFAAANDDIPKNFGALARTPTVEALREERILPWDYIGLMFAACRTERDAALLRVLYYGGLRNVETARLRWRSLTVDDRGRGVLSVLGKRDKRRHVLIPAFLYGRLIRLRASAGDDAPMFVARSGAPLSCRSIHSVVSLIAARARVPGKVSPHWFRHAHVSHALDGRAPIALVQRDAGHASLATTGTYAHSRPDDGSALYLPVM